MPTDALLVSMVICLVFALFAAVLAWLDHSTSAWLREKRAAEAKAPVVQSAKKAA